MNVTLKLYATLTDYLPPAARPQNLVRMDVPEEATIESITTPLRLPPKLVHLVLVNGVFVPAEARPTHRVREGDVIAIWPPIAGG